MKLKLQDFYLDWVNNYLTYEKMAEHYNLTPDQVFILIELGRQVHDEIVQEHKEMKE